MTARGKKQWSIISRRLLPSSFPKYTTIRISQRTNPNPFSIVVMAHLKARELGKGREEERKQWKIRLVRMLYKRRYERKDILELFRFIDWQ